MVLNNLQSNARTDENGNYMIGQGCNLPVLRQYTQERAWAELRSYNLTTRNERLNLLNHYRNRINYLLTLPVSVHPITINLLRDKIALLEVTFEYTIWIQPNIDGNGSQITYYTDDEE